MITLELIQKRIKTFWGYGSFESPAWFVGMEEGFRATSDAVANEKMLERQFLLPTMDGMFDASRPIDRNICDLTNLSPFLPNAKIQPTWKFPITLYLFLQSGRILNENEILDFQRSILADGGKNEVATVELMSLPSPGISSWLYSDIPGFETRKSYFKTYRKSRVQGLKELVQKYSPRLVIFYSLTYLREWTEVIGEMPEEITHQMYFSKTDKTAFCIIPQPQYLPHAYERLYKFADIIKKKLI